MFGYRRPDEHPTFANDSIALQLHVELQINAGGAIVLTKQQQIWRRFKRYFSVAQHGKCGYCECQIIASEDGDIDHYAPKSEVAELSDDPDEWGFETTGLANVTGRLRKRAIAPGYWWLLFDWNNYVLACIDCDRKWKRTFFPVANDPRTWPPQQGIVEQPLLLNPLDVASPWQHFSYKQSGFVDESASSSQGVATVRTCGLNRNALVDARRASAQRAHKLISRFVLDPLNSEKAQDVFDEGAANVVHAGIIRSMFERMTSYTWLQLVRLVKVNINTAPVLELLELPGIGETKAVALIKYREEYGRFDNLEDIEAVTGFGAATLAGIRPRATAR